MNIKCPKCGFSREVADSRLPGNNVIATCPRCGTRFAVRKSEENEEEDIRVVASRAYQREADRFERESAREKNDRQDMQDSNPWDSAPGNIGWIASFYQTVLRVMFSSPYFSSRLKANGSTGRALVFFLVVISIYLAAQYIWGSILLSSLETAIKNDPQMEKVVSFMAQNINIMPYMLIQMAVLVLELYVFTFLLFLAYRILAPGKASFALIFQIVSYSTAPNLLSVVPVVGSIVGLFWFLGCLLSGCRAALNLDWARTVIGFLPILFIIAPIFAQIMSLGGN